MEKIVLHGESETVEFKESLQLKDEIGESISAQRISSSEMRRLAKESGGKTCWDEQVYEGANLKDIDEEKVIINHLKIEKNINRKKGIQLLGVSKSTLLRIFKSLEERGLIKKCGKGKNIYYVLV